MSHNPSHDFIPTGMPHGDSFIGYEFLTGAGTWRCTDVGTRVIVAIRIDEHPDDPSWYNGPPYAVAECSFDEYDQQGYTLLSPTASGGASPPEHAAEH